MNGKTTKVLGGMGRAAIAGLTLMAAGTFSCTDGYTTTSTVAYTTDYPYTYTTYYPVDTAYAGYYWADSWNYYSFYYEGAASTDPVSAGLAGNYPAGGHSGGPGVNPLGGHGGGAGATGAGGSGGATSSTVRATVAAAVEALARGENVCPGQVTVTPKTTTPACSGGTSAEERNGVTISFNGCVVQGATINGMFDVSATRTSSEQTCSSSTKITLNFTETLTNLSISDSNGKIVFPSQMTSATTTYTFGGTPSSITFNTTGELQLSGNAGTGDLTFTGMHTVTINGNSGYKVDGTMTAKDKNGATATITSMGLTRGGGCCRPTGGSFTINRTGGSNPGQSTWSFGPSCGMVMRDNLTITLPACI
jgi:hypothetical protein